MSQLPSRKKTPEELAALRESLGISGDGPPAGAPGGARPQPEADPGEATTEAPEVAGPDPETVVVESAVAETLIPEPSPEPVVLESVETEAEEPTVRERPMRSLRKSANLTVDQPKKVAGQGSDKLPKRRRREAESAPSGKGGPKKVGDSGKIPSRRHSDQELARLRNSSQPAADLPARRIADQTAGPVALAVIYGVGTLLMLLSMAGVSAGKAASIDIPFDWLASATRLEHYMRIVYGLMAAGAVVMLLGAAWIRFRKPISQHHAAILTIIAVLVLVFGTLYFFPGLHGA